MLEWQQHIETLGQRVVGCLGHRLLIAACESLGQIGTVPVLFDCLGNLQNGSDVEQLLRSESSLNLQSFDGCTNVAQPGETDISVAVQTVQRVICLLLQFADNVDIALWFHAVDPPFRHRGGSVFIDH